MPRRPQPPVVTTPEKSDEEMALDELREARKLVRDASAADIVLNEMLDENPEMDAGVKQILVRTQRQIRDIEFAALFREHSLIDNFVPESIDSQESENEDEEDFDEE